MQLEDPHTNEDDLLRQAFDKMSGLRDSEVELVASRLSPSGAKLRVSAVVLRDIGAMPKVARPGFEVAIQSNGLRVDSIIEGTDTFGESELEEDDVIAMINDDFIAGMAFNDVWPLLWGDFASSMEIVVSRLVNGSKVRLSLCVVRDYNISADVPKPSSSRLPRFLSTSTKKTKKSSAPVKVAGKQEAAPAIVPVSKLSTEQVHKKKVGSKALVLVAVLLMSPLAGVHLWLMRTKGLGLKHFNVTQHGPALVHDIRSSLKGGSQSVMEACQVRACTSPHSTTANVVDRIFIRVLVVTFFRARLPRSLISCELSRN